MKKLAFILLFIPNILNAQSDFIAEIDKKCADIDKNTKQHLNLNANFFPSEDYANQYKIIGTSWYDGTKKVIIEQAPMGGQGFYRISAYLQGNSIIKLISEEGQTQSYSQKTFYLKNSVAIELIDQRFEAGKITGKRNVKAQNMNPIHKSIIIEDQKWVKQALKYIFNETVYPEFTKF